MTIAGSRLLELHRHIVRTPSVSGEERAVADFLEGYLQSHGLEVLRLGNNLAATVGSGPTLMFNSHLDTVPAGPGWTRDPLAYEQCGDHLFGLGSNDAKASVASMTEAFLNLKEEGPPCRVVLTLVQEEETGGHGTPDFLPWLRERGLVPDAAVVGEPTGLDVATSQRGLLLLELTQSAPSCHAANAAELGLENPVWALAEDLLALKAQPLPCHPSLGETTLTPTVLTGSDARNRTPAEASCLLDLRTVPGVTHEVLVERLSTGLNGQLKVVSDRLRPYAVAEDSLIVKAARHARPEAILFGSRTMSDLVWFQDVPAVKCGPGKSERSHTPDEFVLESELVEAVGFYTGLARAFGEVAA